MWPRERPEDVHVRGFLLCTAILGLLAADSAWAQSGGAAADSAAPAGAAVPAPPLRRALVEVFTSQGCTACPGAEKYLRYQATPSFQERAVILCWHVDYWDPAGWRDVFGSPANTERQRRYRVKFGMEDLVTPQLVVENEIAKWEELTTKVTAESAHPARLRIGGSATYAKGRIAAEISLEKADPTLTLSASAVALPVLTLARAITRCAGGRNNGKTLDEQFIVLEALDPLPLRDLARQTVRTEFDAPRFLPTNELSVAVLVEDGPGVRTIDSALFPVVEAPAAPTEGKPAK